MHRRELLAVAGGSLAALAGCTGGSPDSGGDGTPTPGESPTPEPGLELTVGDTAEDMVTVTTGTVQGSVVYRTQPDAMDVHATSDEQYLFVGVTASGAAQAIGQDPFSLRLDGETYEPGISAQSPTVGDLVFEFEEIGTAWTDTEQEAGWLVFEVPREVAAYEAAVVLEAPDLLESHDSVRWSYGASVSASLSPPHPDPVLEDVTVPDAVEAGSEFTASITASNAGDADGALRIALNHTGPLYGAWPVSVPVAAGETTTVEETIAIEVDGSAMDLTFAWRDGSQERNVTITDENSDG